MHLSGVVSLTCEATSAAIATSAPELFAQHPTTAWLRDGTGWVAWGCRAATSLRGADSIDQARRWWAHLKEQCSGDATALVAFASFAFDPEAASSTVLVPAVAFRVERNTITHIVVTHAGSDDFTSSSQPVVAPHGRLADTGSDQPHWESVIARAIGQIEDGALTKVALARSCEVVFEQPLDVAAPLTALAQSFPTCWTFLVDGLFGATPEMLVSLTGRQVFSRVLAGTQAIDRDTDALLESDKDLSEHAYTVDSVKDGLSGVTSELTVPESPSILRLPNVAHLATDVTAQADDGVDLFDMLTALHPTAAVGGTPKVAALQAIRDLEDHERGRYAGPVGWFNGTGDGEFCIALRCGQIAPDGHAVRVYAGGGIVAGSDPTAEWLETQAKMRPMLDALGVTPQH